MHFILASELITRAVDLRDFARRKWMFWNDIYMKDKSKIHFDSFFQGNGKIDFQEFISLMEKMTKPTEELASTLEAFRVFDREGQS